MGSIINDISTFLEDYVPYVEYVIPIAGIVLLVLVAAFVIAGLVRRIRRTSSRRGASADTRRA